MNKKTPENRIEDFTRPIEVEDVLDLHGFFPEQVKEIVRAFLQHACEKHYTQVRIIHGKGKSRLKWEVYQILKKHPDVACFGDAPPQTGHWGVTIVELKTKASDSDINPSSPSRD
ncbi:Smr/MutS family protein [bacterium]|nr:Smr/MutS family protein [bacterium]